MVFVSGRPESPGSSASPVSPETISPGSNSWVGGVFRCRSWGSQGFTTAEIGGIVFLVLLFVSLVLMNPLTPFVQYCYEFKTIQESHFCIFIIYWSLLVFPLPYLVMMVLGNVALLSHFDKVLTLSKFALLKYKNEVKPIARNPWATSTT